MWKLKLDDNGVPVVSDGKPVYIKEDGSEVEYDVNQTMQTISRLNGEAKKHREAKEAAESKLASFEGIDPEAATKALETVQQLDQKKLIDAGKVDEVKQEITKQYETKLAEEKKAREEIAERYNSTVRSNAFSRSKFIQEKVAVPVDMIEATFGKNFKVEEDGSLRGYINGQPIYSPDKPGEVASFDEALSVLVNGYSHKDQILKGSGHSGSGSTGGNGGGGGKRQVSRSEFEKMTPVQQTQVATDARDGKAEIIDDA